MERGRARTDKAKEHGGGEGSDRNQRWDAGRAASVAIERGGRRIMAAVVGAAEAWYGQTRARKTEGEGGSKARRSRKREEGRIEEMLKGSRGLVVVRIRRWEERRSEREAEGRGGR